MTRWLGPIALAVSLLACDGGEIAIFSAQPGGAAGMSGTSGSSGVAGSALGGAGDSTAGAPAGGAGGAGAEAGGSSGVSTDPVCQTSNDCEISYYCSKRSCEDAQGFCLPRPFEEAIEQPVCGCDHITYWNDSLRQRYGISASTMGPCDVDAATCGHDATRCATDVASCSHFLSPTQMCGQPPGSGQCWVTPSDCLDDVGGPQFQICPPPGGTGSMPQGCVSKCQAIQSGHPFVALPHGANCP
jgi:hypothetical protein